MAEKLRWEEIERDDNSDIVTYRAEVPDGWLVSVWAQRVNANAGGASTPGGSNWGGGVTFMPDPLHKWRAVKAK